ncbi:uncharacterized protein LOC123540544 [Mercenaria mercenaria]|uniref:uncharacterized protein LOC123540544 n=1 Tax=Mercenaria mercenaria TaxID=6596 RepID=UPI00234FA52B|nr:uncharacterized protein LOC123540544 [Mercenaria mercenaria]XP_045181576.2 uncharacterized protein LOC123540544 [Mercenaria mercenaria]XP_045181577.2 uncharacterized protein LOC123540544 [Mercenaria mercenaria]
MFGNNMYGHYFHMAGQANPGFGTSGFGSQHEPQSAFGSTKKGQSGAFGQANSFPDPNGLMHHGYDGVHHHGHGILRQNSLLGEMTQSKAERAKGIKPWAFSSISFPAGHDDNVLSSMYEKPMEKPKPKPVLARQQSMSVADSLEKRRAPSFSSDPERMRSRTISASSLPSARPKVSRSLSIAEDITEPVNMDIAAPFLRRQQSLDVEKMRRKSLPKKPLLPLNILKHRRSSKVKENLDKSETSSLQIPSRSRSNTAESRKSSKSSTSSQKLSPTSQENFTLKDSDSKPQKAKEEEKLILSLLNPEIPDDNVFEPKNSHEDSIIKNENDTPKMQTVHADVSPIIESPTMVIKRVHQLQSKEPDTDSIKSNDSGKLTPQQTRSRTSSKSSKKSRSPTRSTALLAQGPILVAPQKPADHLDGTSVPYTDQTDSDNSDVYYECNNQSQKNSPRIIKNENISAVKSKKRSVKKPRDTCSSSTCTDGEDTTSTCETPPRSTFRDIQQKHRPEAQNELDNCSRDNDFMPQDIHEAETLRVRDKGFQGKHREKPSLKRLSDNYSFSRKMHETSDEDNTKIPSNELLVPNYAPVLKAEPGSKETLNNDNGTADSSESGYATSYIPTSPKSYDHIKVSQFVNSLPNYPDMDEHRSESSHNDGVLNGSETESDLDDDNKIHNYPPADLDLTSVNCASGSDSENESVKTDASISKLEVMKILESPTDVRVRVTGAINGKANGKSHARFEDTQPKCSNIRKGSNASETELLKLVKADKDEFTDGAPEKIEKKKHVEVNSVVVSTDSPLGEGAETKLLQHQEKQPTSFATSMIEKFSFRREYSSLYQSKSTNCIDGLLHFLNLLLFLSSAGVIGLGIWLQLKDFNVNDITMILGNNLLQIITYVAIAGAGVALLAACCLCCGIRQDKSGLGFYAFVLVAVVIAFASAAVLCTIFSDKLKGIEFRFNFKDRLVTMYGVKEGDVKNQFFTSAWDNMQSEFECCGGDGNGNDTESWLIYRKSAWYLQYADKGTMFVPESCCKKNSNIQICQGGDPDLLGPPRYAPPKKLKKYYKELNPNLNHHGCYPSFSGYLSELSMYIAIVCGSLAGLYFLTVMLTWVFCFKKSQDYNESFMDDSYYDIEDNDEVFNSEDSNAMNKDRDANHTVEETKFINTPVKSVNRAPDIILNVNLKVRDSDTSRMYGGYTSNSYDRDNESSDDSESDDEIESGRSTPKEVIDRRNMWLSSASTAGHLLSIAIEEEDSNFEDSDDDRNISANV